MVWEGYRSRLCICNNFNENGLFGTDKLPTENRVSLQRVVHDVADEKNGREREGQQHAFAS
jgi:hypothetical protein